MTDTSTSTETGEEQEEQASTSGQSSQSSQSTETVDWKAHAKEWEKRAKENADAARKLAEIEEKNKSDQQKAAEKLAKAEAKEAEANRILLRAEVAAAKGLTPTLAARLQGDNRKEIEADADALLADMKAAGTKPDLKQGDRGSDAPTNDVDAWIRKQAGR